MAYIGVSPSNGVRQKHTYTATASQTTFSGAGSEGVSLSYRDSNYVDVYRNGVKLGDADYTATSGTSVVLGEGAAVNDIVEIITYDVFSVADTVSKADGGTFDGNVTMAGTLGVTGETTLSTHLNMGDNDIIKLGDSADLQISHDGSNSNIDDTGTGPLRISSNGTGIDFNKGTSETMAKFKTDGAVELYYDGAKKLATTSTGIDVTGTAKADYFRPASNQTDPNDGSAYIYQQSGVGWDFAALNLKFSTGTSGNRAERMRITSGGDFQLYEDTGTTPKFFWDASAESLGIGTSSPASILEVTGAVTDQWAGKFVNTHADGYGVLVRTSGSTSNDIAFDVQKNATESALRILGDGNVGIGNSAPQELVHLQKTGGSTIRFQNTGTRVWSIGNDSTSFVFDDVTAGSERMRIDSSGNLLVGTTDDNPANNNSNTSADNGIVLHSDAKLYATRHNGTPVFFNRTGSDGGIIELRKSGSIVGNIVNRGSTTSSFVGYPDATNGAGISATTNAVVPTNGVGAAVDNAIDLGTTAARWDDVYATNGTIQTSDQQEKNTITNSDLGIDFIKRLTPKSYIFNGKTRTHYGLIAQDVETVLSDISKPTSGFAGFIKSDISEEQDGSEYRYGLRYTEFVAPLIQAVKDQQAIIEDLQARITALENAE